MRSIRSLNHSGRGLQAGTSQRKGPYVRGLVPFVFFILVMCLAFPVPGEAEPTLPRDEIPQDLAPDIRRLIEGLYSKDPIERGKSAALLGYGGGRAVTAIPYLISNLGDDVQLKWIGNSLWKAKMPYPGIISSPGEEAQKALGRIGKPAIEPLIKALEDSEPDIRTRAANALKTITENDMGTDHVLWQTWWDENKETFPKGLNQ